VDRRLEDEIEEIGGRIKGNKGIRSTACFDDLRLGLGAGKPGCRKRSERDERYYVWVIGVSKSPAAIGVRVMMMVVLLVFVRWSHVSAISQAANSAQLSTLRL